VYEFMYVCMYCDVEWPLLAFGVFFHLFTVWVYVCMFVCSYVHTVCVLVLIEFSFIFLCIQNNPVLLGYRNGKRWTSRSLSGTPQLNCVVVLVPPRRRVFILCMHAYIRGCMCKRKIFDFLLVTVILELKLFAPENITLKAINKEFICMYTYINTYIVPALH
jgi:hypothetical protein